MRKFVIFSRENYFLPVAMRLESPCIWADMSQEDTEPDEAKEMSPDIPKKAPEADWEPFFAWQSDQRRLKAGEGIITRYEASEVVKRLLRMEDKEKRDVIVIFDFNHGVKFGEKLLKAGFKGIFAQGWAYDLERKRDKAAEMVKRHYKDVRVPRNIKFGTGSSDKMIQFMEKEKDSVWVVKPNGQGMWVFAPSSDDPPVALEQCTQHIAANKSQIDGCPMVLQEKIIGTEINIETGYYCGDPMFSVVDLENKFMHPEECGHQSGCAFDLVFPVPLDCKLRMMCNQPFDAMAKKLKFTGLMDMNAIISNKDGYPYFIEFCPNRFGYNALFTEMEAYGKGAEQYLVDFVEGKIKWPKGVFGASIKLFQEDWEEDKMKSIFNPDHEDVEVQVTADMDHLWMFDSYKKGGKYYLAGYSPEPIVATAASDTPQGAIEKAKFIADRSISYDGKYYRGDNDEHDRLYSPVYRYSVLRDRRLLEPAE